MTYRHDGIGPLVFILSISALPALALGGFRQAGESFGVIADGKAAFTDFNGDGFVDLFAGGRLYINEGGKRLVVAEKASVKGAPGIGGVWGDFNNDGLPDLFVYSGDGRLYRNLGQGHFQKAAFPKLPAKHSRGAVWADLDLDGRLDLFVGGYEVWQKGTHDDVVYMNRGDNEWVESWRSPEGSRYAGRGVTAADYDVDGDTDIYVSNYRLQPNQLWQNDGRGNLKDVASASGAAGSEGKQMSYTGGIKYARSGHTIGSAIGDMDNDGYPDLFIANFSHPNQNQDHPQFLRNRGPGAGFTFEDMSKRAGLKWQESYASAALGDFDNDGDLDLFLTTVYAVASGSVKNHPVLYRNDGGWRFTDVTQKQGLGKLGATYQAAWADIDNDGDLDLCTNGKFFINDSPPKQWVSFFLQGDGRVVNHSAIGATVRLRLESSPDDDEESNSKVLTRSVQAGTGEGNQSDPRLHFGLGSFSGKVSIEVLWPGGYRQVVHDLEVNKAHAIQYKHAD